MGYSLSMSEEFICTREAEDIFHYIVDFSRITEWDKNLIASKKVSEGAIGKGSRFDVTYKMGRRTSIIEYEITEFEAPTRAVFVGKAATFTAKDTITLSPHASGCHVHWQADLEFFGRSEKIIPYIKKRVIKSGTQTIRDLAKALKDNYPAPTLSLGNSVADKLIFPGLLNFSKYGYHRAVKSWNPVTADVRGKHMLVTGFTSGLGLATAHELANRGAELTLVARDKEKAEKVISDIKIQTGNKSIHMEIADLSLINDVVALSDRLLTRAAPIDVLINNAGALLNPRRETAEGIEASFALLLLSPVVLTQKCLPLLQAAKSARVINVSSGGMYAKRLSVSNLESNKGSYSGSEAYARAKRGLVICGEQWATLWKNKYITVHNMHPGWARTPGVEESLPEFNKKADRLLRTPEQGADTIIWLACATEVAQTSGLFWLDRHPHSTHLMSKTRETESQRQDLFRALEEYAQRFDVRLNLGKN